MAKRSHPTTRVIAKDEFERWDSFVNGQSLTGSIYSTSEYLTALCEVSGATFRIIISEEDSDIVGGIALYCPAEGAGAQVCNRLLLYYNGFVFADSLLTNRKEKRLLKVTESLVAALDEESFQEIILHTRCTDLDFRPFLQHGWSFEPTYTYVAELSDLTVLKKRADKNAKRLIRRAENEGITVHLDNDFDAFFSMHLEIHQRKGAPLYLAADAYRLYFRHLQEKELACIFTARDKDETPVASQLVLLGKNRDSYTVCAGAREEFLSSGSTYALRWGAFEHLAQQGYLTNDLTDAALGPVSSFKQQLGGSLRMNMVLRSPESLTQQLKQTVAGQTKRLGRAIKKRIPGL